MQGRAMYAQRRWLTWGSLAALGLGFSIGTWAHGSANPQIVEAAMLLNPIGAAWVKALRMIVVPLVVSQLVCTLVMTGGGGALGRVTSAAFGVFIALLIAGAALTVAIMPAALTRLEFAPAALSVLRDTSPAAMLPDPTTMPGRADWLSRLVPDNVFRAASQDDLFGLMLFAVAFGLAVAQMPAIRRAPITELFRTIAEAMMTILRWLLWVMPLAVFSLALTTSSRAGVGAVDVMVTFVVLMAAALCTFTLLQYAIAALAGGVSMRRFAAAVFPVQIVALTTRSSIASLPLLLDRARTSLGLRDEVTNVVMPLAVSTFKVNRAVSSPFQFMFLAHVYGVDLSTVQILTFTAMAILLSFTTVGIPSGGSPMRSAPLYVAAGIPIEGYLLAEAVESIPDLFKTMLNVTGNMTAAVIVNRLTAPAAAVVDGNAAPAAAEIAAGV